MNNFIYCNQKGGVGKSTFAVHHALYALKKERRVLVIDLDSQANSSFSLQQHSARVYDSLDLFSQNLTCAPSTFTLFQGSPTLNDVERMPHQVLSYYKSNVDQLKAHFDICIIDTPPTLGLRLMSALIAGQYVVCPFELAGYSMQGLGQMIATVEGIRTRYNASLRLLGFFPNRVNTRSNAHRTAMHEICTEFSDYIIQKKMVNRVAVQEALDHGCAVWDLKTSTAKIATQEVIDLLETIESLADP